MCDRIYKAVSENFIRQMRNWALTTAGVIPMSYAMSSCYGISAKDTYGDGGEPILIGEAEDINVALLTMPLRFRIAVMLFWQYEGRPLAWFARRCGDGVDWRTFERRVVHGHELLKAAIARQHEKMEHYREALRKLQNA
jgi:hypothetical protein